MLKKKKKLQHLIRDFNKRYRDRQTYWERIRAFHDRWTSLWWSLLLNVLSTFSGTVFLILIMLTSLLQPSRLLISTLSPLRARCLEFMIYIRGARKKMSFARCKFSRKMPLIACEFHRFFGVSMINTQHRQVFWYGSDAFANCRQYRRWISCCCRY